MSNFTNISKTTDMPSTSLISLRPLKLRELGEVTHGRLAMEVRGVHTGQ